MGQGDKIEDFADDARGVVVYGVVKGTTTLTRMIVDTNGQLITVEDSFSSIVSGRKAVASKGTAEKVIASSTPCRGVLISADTGNQGEVVIGGSNVVAVAGSQVGTVLFAGNPAIKIMIDDLSDLWIDSQFDGDAVAFTYLET